MEPLPFPPEHLPQPRRRNKNGEIVHEFLVRIPEALYETMRERAHRDRMTQAQVVRTALKKYLAANASTNA